MKENKIVIVGIGGTMGSAIASRFESIRVKANGLTRESLGYEHVIQQGEIYLLCMKQKDEIEWLEKRGKSLEKGAIVLSLSAFLSISVLENACKNADVHIGRFMTTTDIQDGNDEIVWTSDGRFNQEQMQKVQGLFKGLGRVRYVGERQDAQIDKKTYRACVVGFMADTDEATITALMLEARFTRSEAEEAVENGHRVVNAQRKRGLTHASIRNAVTSKGGLTEKAILARHQGLYASMRSGMKAMVTRGEEIAAIFGHKKGA